MSTAHRISSPVGSPDAATPSTSRRTRPGLSSSVTNVVLYQVGWFGCVLAAAAGRPVLSAMAALVPAALHLVLARQRQIEAVLLIGAGLLGLVVDTVTVRTGILGFDTRLGPEGIAPLWIVALWAQFGMTLRYCFGWLSGRYALASALGFVGGPLSFLAGARLGAVEISQPTLESLFFLGLMWAVALPVLTAAADLLDGRFEGGAASRGRYRLEPLLSTTTAFSAGRTKNNR